MASMIWNQCDSLLRAWPAAPTTLLLTALLSGLVLIVLRATPRTRILTINGRRPFEFSDAGVKARYRADPKGLLLQGLAKSNAFYLNTDNRRLLVLANEYVAEVGKSPQMDLSGAVEAELPCHVPGFEGFRVSYFPDRFGPGVMRNKFGKSFEPYVTPMSVETSAFLQAEWTRDSAWHALPLRPTCTKLLTRLTTPVRSGDELSQHEEWIRISVDFQSQIYIAAADLARWPRILHPVVYPFLPSVQKLRADVARARAIFEPIIDARRAKRRQAAAAGEDPPKHEDLVDWLEEGAKGKTYDAAVAQLVNSQALATPAADLVVSILVNVAQRPELQRALREEMRAVVGDRRPDQDDLARLHLMDSVAKESSRYKSIHTVGLKRWVAQPVTLSDGFVIPGGSLVAIAMQHAWDEAIYPSALEFQGDRFLRQRQRLGAQEEREARWTTPSEDHLGFGFGRHACPGRWFASHMVKLVLCQILDGYEMRLVSGAQYQEVMEIRRREGG